MEQRDVQKGGRKKGAEEGNRKRRKGRGRGKENSLVLYPTPKFSFTTTGLPSAALKRSKGQKENKKRRERMTKKNDVRRKNI